MSAILRDEPVPPREVRPDAPERLATLIDRCLAKAPADRPPSARDVSAELLAVRRGWDTGAVTGAPSAVSTGMLRAQPSDLRIAVLPFGSRGGDEAEPWPTG